MHLNRFSLFNVIVLFLLINTLYFWQTFLGAWMMLAVILLFINYLFLVIILIYQFYLLTRHWSINKGRLWKLIAVFVILLIIAAKPQGIINYKIFEGKDMLFARRDGVAHCTTVLRLKENGEFEISDFCFGSSKSVGKFTIKNDTVILKFSTQTISKKFTFGVYKPRNFEYRNLNDVGEIRLYTSAKDTTPFVLPVYENRLFKNTL